MKARIKPGTTTRVARSLVTPPRQGHHVRDNLRFLRLWLRRPASFGALLPSGKSLARAIAAQIDPTRPGTVVELGGGTGSITAALLERGIATDDLLVIEREIALVNLLSARFPSIQVLSGDARRTASLVARARVGPVKAVVSGLPLLSLPATVCHEVITQAFKVLPADGTMVQFTYGPLSPVSRSLAERLDIVGERVDWVLDNVPPASVWSYHRRRR